jgi:serine/threonine protein kinase
MLSSSRIALQGLTPHPHEQEAIRFVTKELPDSDPFRIWALFDLVDLSGRRYEIDLLVLGFDALYHVELKGHPGRVTGDVVDWLFTFPDGGTIVRENPLRLAEHKSRVLGSLLDRHFGPRRPYVETLVFLTDPDVRVDLQGAARTNVVTRKDFVRAIQFGEFPGANPARRRSRIDRPTAKAVAEALRAIGVRKSQGALRVGSYVLGALIDEGPGYQDRSGQKERFPDIRRRVRSYLVPQSPTAERREQLLRAAEREAKILTAIGDHPGILRMTDYEADGPTGGPCVLFEDFEGARPLDAFLRQNPGLPFDKRLQIIEQVADALGYCHRKKVLHRGLAPSAVLVRPRPDGKGVETKLFNFQLATHSDGSQGTVHLSQLSGEPSLVYRAPELIEDPAKASEASDVFSLGALAYFTFTGRHPGMSLAERQTLLEAGGGKLSLAAVGDSFAAGAMPADGFDNAHRTSLDEVLAYATDQNPLDRFDDPIAWVQVLLEEVTTPEPAKAADGDGVDPLEARPGQMLSGYEVVKVLGTGASARGLRVTSSGATFALKVSRAHEFDERLEAEAEALKKLRGDRIVGYEKTLKLGGRLCLLLEDAGETLAEILAKEGPQSLDFARRWGEDLLHAMRELERRHILHRDIKPANLGVPSSEAKRTRNLFLFDFSLAGIDPREVTVGTPAYRDPFVVTRGRWDEAADRYSAAVTLYEILTGTRPRWGTGEAAATATTDDAVIEAERFDPSVRDKLLAFFKKAFARKVEERHESAEQMREAWLACFLAPKEEEKSDVPREVDVQALVDATPIVAIDGLSVRAKNALDRSCIICVRDLRSLPTNQLSAIRGIGRDTAREIVGLIQRVKATRTEAPVEDTFLPAFAGADLSIEQLAELPAAAVVALENAGFTRAQEIAGAPRARLERVLSRVPKGIQHLESALKHAKAGSANDEPRTLDDWIQRAFPTDTKWKQYVRELLAIDEAPGGGFITEATELARRHEIQPPNVYIALGKARDAWREDSALASISQAVTTGLAAQGGVSSIQKIGQLLLETLPNDGSDRATRMSAALVRVVAEIRDNLVHGRVGKDMWIAEATELLTLARVLGETADRLSVREPLLSFDQARDELLERAKGSRLAGLSAERLVSLASEASTDTEVSARLELYPKGMSAERALRLSAGALSSARILPAQVRQIVSLRYPKAAPLPNDDPELAAIVKPLGLELRDGMFERPGALISTTKHTEMLPPRKPTTHSRLRPTTDPKEQEKREFQERLRTAARNRSFRVLEVAAAYAEQAAQEVARVLDVLPISLEHEILHALDVAVHEQDIEPEIIVETDRKGPDGSDDWRQLTQLVEDCAVTVVNHLVGKKLLLLTQPGVLARYQLAAPLHTLLQATQRDDGPGVFLIVPAYSDNSPTPVIDAPTGSLPVPLSSPGQRLRIPDAWISNE